MLPLLGYLWMVRFPLLHSPSNLMIIIKRQCTCIIHHPGCCFRKYQGGKKASVTACHKFSKMSLVYTSPGVFSTSPKNYLMSSIDYTDFLYFKLLKKNLRKLRKKFFPKKKFSVILLQIVMGRVVQTWIKITQGKCKI